MTIWPWKWERTINTYKADKMQVNGSCWIWRLPQIKTPPIMHQLKVSCIKPLEASFIFLSTSEAEIWQSKNFLNNSGNLNNWIWLPFTNKIATFSLHDEMAWHMETMNRKGVVTAVSPALAANEWAPSSSVSFSRKVALCPHTQAISQPTCKILLSSTATEGQNSACTTETITTDRVPQEVTCWQLTWRIVAGRIPQLQSGTRSH